MARIATAKQTGGGGFGFEDKVTAYFLAHLLSGKYPLQPELGLIERIDFQVRPLGWLFDDLLLTMNDGINQHKVAVSAKSNRQITATGFPDDILTDIWTQYLNASQQLFDPQLDYLLFIVSPIARSVSENLSNLINTVRVTSPADVIKRLATKNFSVPVKTLFNSFKCPAALKAAHNVSDAETCNLLLRILVKEFDFQNNASNDEVSLISHLQGCLESKQPAEAGFLFTRLAGLRKEYAPSGGYIDYLALLSKISGQFRLVGLAEHTQDWNKIDRFTQTKLDNIPDLLGQSYAIKRDSEVEGLAAMLTAQQVVFLLGPSGSGKTVLAKKMAKKVIAVHSKVLWFDASMLMSNNVEQLFNIEHSIKDLIAMCQATGNLLVIDGADRLYKKEFVDTMATLIRSVIGVTSTVWNILITSQQDDYEELVKKLSRSNLTITLSDIFDLKAVDREELLNAAERFPQLAELVKHDHLLKLLVNLKFLDLVIYNISKENSPQLLKDVGESHLIDWLWQQEILDKSENGAMNSRFLQSLAEKQANELTLFTPVTEFLISESVPITNLKQHKIIDEVEDKLFFRHDLYGDWARYKMIRANKDKIYEYLPKLDLFSPLWSKAIRLFGIYLLEKQNDSKEWLAIYKGFDRADPVSRAIQNLLLESIIFSNDTQKYLNDLWEEFKKDDAKLLNHFFEQFFFKATLPNPVILQLAEKLQGITVSQLATFHRVPKFIYWIPVMRFISGHVDELMELSRKNAVRFAKDWLEYTPPGAIFRNQAAEISLKLAKWFIAFKDDGGFATDHSGKDFYGPMLMAFREKQAEVKELSLQLSARLQPEKAPKKERDDYPFLRSYNPRRGTVLPDGPGYKIDDDFQEACLDTENLIPMMELNPALAKEILLAVLLSEPEHVQDPSSHNFKYDIHEPHQWFPPFYNRGPFLNFFKTVPAEALSFVLTLTNFAIEEWKLEQQARQEEITFITLDISGIGKKEFYGDNRVYYWFRDIGNAAHSLISILMALEKFLIDLIDSGKGHEEFIKQILENSNSLALVGLLSSVGRYSPKLFLTVLQPLLECFELYQLESSLDYGAMNTEGHQMIGSNFMDSTTWELASKWHSMPHRKTSIRSVALPLMIGNEEINSLFKNKIIPEWTKLNQQRDDEGYTDPFLVNMIAQFNSENYIPYKDEHNVGLIYQEPEDITQQLQPVRSATSADTDDFSFAFSKQRELESNRKYEIDELEKIWEKVQIFVKQPKGDLFEHLNKRLSNIFAGIAILVVNKETLLRIHPEYFEWIDQAVGDVLEQVTFDLRESTMFIGPGSWEGFAAKFVPRLFVKDPANKTYRRWMGILALHANNETVGLIFKETSHFLKFNDPVFVQLQNLHIQRCRLVNQQHPSRWDEETDWKKVFEEILNDYSEGKTTDALIDICGFISEPIEDSEADESHHRRRQGRRFQSVHDPGIDLDLLFPALQFPELESITESKERNYILGWYQKLVDLMVLSWGEIKEESLPLDISLHSFDHTLILRLSLLLPKLEREEAEKLWKPILAYGNISAKWLHSFFDNLVINNYQKPENYEALGKVWNDMIIFAKTEDTWKFKKGIYHDHWKLWQYVLGISNIQIEVWKIGYQELLLKVSKKIVERITKVWMNPEAINKLAVLLRSPSAKEFINPGILLIDMHLKFRDKLDKEDPPAGMVRMPFDYYDSVANACSYLWTNHKPDIINDEKILQPFKNIIIHLVAIQNPIGLELQDRLIE